MIDDRGWWTFDDDDWWWLMIDDSILHSPSFWESDHAPHVVKFAHQKILKKPILKLNLSFQTANTTTVLLERTLLLIFRHMYRADRYFQWEIEHYLKVIILPWWSYRVKCDVMMMIIDDNDDDDWWSSSLF